MPLQLNWLGSEPQGPISPPRLPALGLQVHSITPDSYVGAEDPNSGPTLVLQVLYPAAPSLRPARQHVNPAVRPEGSHLPCIVDNAEVSSVLQLPWLLKLGVGTLLLNQFFDKSLIGGFREPALFIQEGQHTRRIGLIMKGSGGDKVDVGTMGATAYC